MKAILCPNPGGDLSTLEIIEAPIAEPRQGEVRIRMQAVSLNPVDWKLCTGVAPWWQKSMIVGVDGAGVIDAIGEGVEGFSIGERVAWHHNLNTQGVFADYALTDARVVAKIPDGVSFEAAAALPCAGMTAYQALMRKCRINANDVLLAQGASGGAGGFAVQVAKSQGAQVIALSRKENFDYVKSLGADFTLDYRVPNLPEAVREIAPDGVDIMFQVVQAQDSNQDFQNIRYNGQFATTDPLPDLSHIDPYHYALSIHEVALGGAYAANDVRTLNDFPVMLGALLEGVRLGEISPMIESEIAFEDIPEGLMRLKKGGVIGKIVAKIEGTA